MKPRHVLYGLCLGVLAFTVILIFHRIVVGPVQHFFGFDNGQGNDSHYLFWSGAGSDLAYLSIIAGALIYYRKENCKVRWCPFLGHYDLVNPETGITRKVCGWHHPQVHHRTLTMEHVREIQAKHHLHLGDRPGHG
jgi:hypothetical protein